MNANENFLSGAPIHPPLCGGHGWQERPGRRFSAHGLDTTISTMGPMGMRPSTIWKPYSLSLSVTNVNPFINPGWSTAHPENLQADISKPCQADIDKKQSEISALQQEVKTLKAGSISMYIPRVEYAHMSRSHTVVRSYMRLYMCIYIYTHDVVMLYVI